MSAIILASQSPRRKQLLEWAEVDCEVIVNPTDESFPAHLPIEEVPIYIARRKAEAILPKAEGKLVIAADTIVVIGEEIINKPSNREEAIADRQYCYLRFNSMDCIDHILCLYRSL